MKEDFVTYDLAVKLKDKGYPQNGNHYYNEKGCIDIPAYNLSDEDVSDTIAPQIHEVLKWLRKEKKIYCLPYFEQGIDMWLYAICRPLCGCEYPQLISESIYDSYEQASIEGITWVLDNLI